MSRHLQGEWGCGFALPHETTLKRTLQNSSFHVQSPKEHKMKQRFHLCPSEVVSSLWGFEIGVILAIETKLFTKITLFQTPLYKEPNE